jgi:hypothetical protein
MLANRIEKITFRRIALIDLRLLFNSILISMINIYFGLNIMLANRSEKIAFRRIALIKLLLFFNYLMFPKSIDDEQFNFIYTDPKRSQRFMFYEVLERTNRFYVYSDLKKVILFHSCMYAEKRKSRNIAEISKDENAIGKARKAKINFRNN